MVATDTITFYHIDVVDDVENTILAILRAGTRDQNWAQRPSFVGRANFHEKKIILQGYNL